MGKSFTVRLTDPLYWKLENEARFAGVRPGAHARQLLEGVLKLTEAERREYLTYQLDLEHGHVPLERDVHPQYRRMRESNERSRVNRNERRRKQRQKQYEMEHQQPQADGYMYGDDEEPEPADAAPTDGLDLPDIAPPSRPASPLYAPSGQAQQQEQIQPSQIQEQRPDESASDPSASNPSQAPGPDHPFCPICSLQYTEDDDGVPMPAIRIVDAATGEWKCAGCGSGGRNPLWRDDDEAHLAEHARAEYMGLRIDRTPISEEEKRRVREFEEESLRLRRERDAAGE